MAPRNKENSGQKKGSKGRRKSEERTSGHSSGGEANDDDYRRRRDRNNQAVKKSRVKSKMRTQQTLERVQKLKTENEMLEEKIKVLTKELGFLKHLFLAHAGSAHGVKIENIDLETLLRDDSSEGTELGSNKPSDAGGKLHKRSEDRRGNFTSCSSSCSSSSRRD